MVPLPIPISSIFDITEVMALLTDISFMNPELIINPSLESYESSQVAVSLGLRPN